MYSSLQWISVVLHKLQKHLWFADILLSLSFAVTFFILWPTRYIFDDGAIILRYMDNFARGYFFTYNPADGPIFGISGFLHGLLAGTFAYAHLFTPFNSLMASNFVGLTAVSYISLRILCMYNPDRLYCYPAWLLLMSSCPNFIVTIKQGLETPLHLTFVLLCFWMFMRKTPWMWLTFILAVISKLDAVPIVGILAVFWFLSERRIFLDSVKAATIIRQITLFGVIPAALWIIFTMYVFGSPMPQSAFAKLYYHYHPAHNWFPFFLTWFSENQIMFAVFGWLVTVTLMTALFSRKHETIFSLLPYGFSAMAFLALYYFYNPGEQMVWYYAPMEFLIMLQVAVIFLAASNDKHFHIKLRLCSTPDKKRDPDVILQGPGENRFAGKTVFAVVILVCFCLFIPGVFGKMRTVLHWIKCVEPERIAVGEWVKIHSSENAVLFNGHGHVARCAQLYTIDYSGLNSKIATDYGLNRERMIFDLAPDWVVRHGVMPENQQETCGYMYRKSFYTLSGLMGIPAWRIYERVQVDHALNMTHRVTPEMTRVNGEIILNKIFRTVEGIQTMILIGTRFVFEDFQHEWITEFHVGIVKQRHPFQLHACIRDTSDQVILTDHVNVPAIDWDDPFTGLSQEWVLYTDPHVKVSKIKITACTEDQNPLAVKLAEPMYLSIREYTPAISDVLVSIQE